MLNTMDIAPLDNACLKFDRPLGVATVSHPGRINTAPSYRWLHAHVSKYTTVVNGLSSPLA